MASPARRSPFIYLFLIAIAFALIDSGGTTSEVVAVDEPGLSDELKQRLEAVMAEKASRTAAQQKVSTRLLWATKRYRHDPIMRGIPQSRSAIHMEPDGTTRVKIEGQVSDELIVAIEGLGGRVLGRRPRYEAIYAYLPLEAVEDLASRDDVYAIQEPDKFKTNQTNTTEGDVAHRADVARSFFGIDGSGVKACVISNGVDALSDLQESGDLPPGVDVLPGQAGSGSAGTAMLEIIHDLAPGADLGFATAGPNQAQMATNIADLAASGCDIIVDDFVFVDEPIFQDGPVAQAASNAVAGGVIFFSVAGNGGNFRDGTASVWEGDFNNSGVSFPGPPTFGDKHDFGGGDVTNEVMSDSPFPVGLQWADPLGGSDNDYDLCLIDPSGSIVIDCSTNMQDGTQDPLELVLTPPLLGEQIIIINVSGFADTRFLHLDAFGAPLEHSTNGGIGGHAGAEDVITVGAADVAQAGGGPFDATAHGEDFSSDGPRRVYFDEDGNPFTPDDFTSTGGIVRDKPDFIAADGVSTATPGFNPFFGTSAAAPHAAGIAVLMLDLDPDLRSRTGRAVDLIREILRNSGIDIGPPGPILDAFAAIDRLLIAVPDVVGLDQGVASSAIVDAGLTVGVVTLQESDTVPDGAVISQDPAAGTSLAPGSAVDLVVSIGAAPGRIRVPHVAGLDQVDASSAIVDAGLTVGVVTSQDSDTVQFGAVISQDPVAGTLLRPPSAVDLVVSTGPMDVAVPDVVGLSQADTEAAIIAAGLTVGGVTTEHSDTVPAGDVISAGAFGFPVPPGTAVDVVVSSGPAPITVRVPDVVGVSELLAEIFIEDAGLVLGVVTSQNSDTAAGFVISQSPVAGASVAEGSEVALVLSDGPTPPVFTKKFDPNPVGLGGTTTLEFNITNPTTLDATDISFTDDVGLAALGLPISNVCGAGSELTAADIIGGGVLLLTGGSLIPGETCTFSVELLVPPNVASGTYPNTTSELTASVGSAPVSGPPATDDLKVNLFSIPTGMELVLQADDVSVPFGPGGSLVKSSIEITGQGSGSANLTVPGRSNPGDVVDGDPLDLDSLLDVLYDVTITDVDTVLDYDPHFDSSVFLTGLTSVLKCEFEGGLADTSRPNLGAIPQLQDCELLRDNTVPLPNGSTLFIPSSRLITNFTDQTPGGDFGDVRGLAEIIFADGFESGDTSAWSTNPTFTVATAGTLTIIESVVIPGTQVSTITIEKDSVSDDPQDFAFTGTGPGTITASFSLDDDAEPTLPNARTFQDLPIGVYTFTEDPVSGFDLTDLVCTIGGTGDTATRTATIDLMAGDNVSCTFTNTTPSPTQRPATPTATPLPPPQAPLPTAPEAPLPTEEGGLTGLAVGLIILGAIVVLAVASAGGLYWYRRVRA